MKPTSATAQRWQATVVSVCLGWLIVAPSARAITCDPSYFPPANEVRYRNITVPTWRFDQQSAFWSAIGILAYDASSDYDVKVYDSCLGTQVLGASTYVGGYTDFVVGDFNNNPTGWYAADLYCFGGPCSLDGNYAAATWRTGSQILLVDFPPTTVSFGSEPYSPDMVLRVWDVFLSAGNTYYFQFSSSLGTSSKMLLFRNPNNGTYWAGRNQGEFQVTGCTSYTAPTTGYYGLVVVNDVWAAGTYTVGVTSTPQCACANELLAGVPVAVPAEPATSYSWVNQTHNSWAAIGTRPAAGSDWDLEVSSSAGSPGCPQTVLATSTAGSSVADFVMTDFNYSSNASLAVRAFRYSGAGGATNEWDRDASFGQTLRPNGSQLIRSWGPSDLLESWDVYLLSGQEYTFEFYPTSNIRLYLFRNPGTGLYSTGRNGAVALGTATFTYTAPSSGYYGVVAVKDDDQPGTFAMRVGRCVDPEPLTPMSSILSYGFKYLYLSIAPSSGGWTAVGCRSMAADWDLVQYGSTTSAPWSDCFTPAVAVSEAALTPDFIVGDFHHNAPDTYPIRAKQFSSGDAEPVTLQWAGPARRLGVNEPAIVDSMVTYDVLRIYEAFLVAGWTYQIGYGQSGSRPLLVFFNPTSGGYWAPRGAAQLSTLGNTTFTAVTTGYHAFVVANDGAEAGNYSLRISTTTLVDVESGDRDLMTRFEGARPNPARSDVTLSYTLGTVARVRLDLLDLSGRRVWSHDEGKREPGQWSVPIAAVSRRLPSGLYFVQFEVDGRVMGVHKLALLE